MNVSRAIARLLYASFLTLPYIVCLRWWPDAVRYMTSGMFFALWIAVFDLRYPEKKL